MAFLHAYILHVLANSTNHFTHSLKHFWNQRVHEKLDRFAALDLLNWCEKSVLPAQLSFDEQHKLLIPLNELNSLYRIEDDGVKHYVVENGCRHDIYVYPSMWSRKAPGIPINAIALSDKMMINALPKADMVIRQSI